MIMRIPILIAFLFLALVSHAQLSITGRVTVATDNQPAIGVTVMVQGTTTGTVTDFDGNYAITVPDRNAVLVFSYTGYASQDLVVGDRASIDVALEESVSLLNEVVVTGYGSQKRSNISVVFQLSTQKKLPSGRLRVLNKHCKAVLLVCRWRRFPVRRGVLRQ
jgi:hypothetical protein